MSHCFQPKYKKRKLNNNNVYKINRKQLFDMETNSWDINNGPVSPTIHGVSEFVSITSPRMDPEEPALHQPTPDEIHDSPYHPVYNNRSHSPSPSHLSDFKLSLEEEDERKKIILEPLDNNKEDEQPNIYIEINNKIKMNYEIIDFQIMNMDYEEKIEFKKIRDYVKFHEELKKAKSWYEFNQTCKKYTSGNNNYAKILNLYYHDHHPSNYENLLIHDLLYMDTLVTEDCYKNKKKPPVISICPWYLLYRLREMDKNYKRMYVPVVQKSVNNFNSKFSMIMRKVYDDVNWKMKYEKLLCPSFASLKLNEQLLNNKIDEDNLKMQKIIKNNNSQKLFLGFTDEYKKKSRSYYNDINAFDYPQMYTVQTIREVCMEEHSPYKTVEECKKAGHNMIRCMEAGACVCLWCGYEEYFLIPNSSDNRHFQVHHERDIDKKRRYFYNRLWSWEECFYSTHAMEIWKQCENKNISKMYLNICEYIKKNCILPEYAVYLKHAFPLGYFHLHWEVDEMDLMLTYGDFEFEYGGNQGKIGFVLYKLSQIQDSIKGTKTAENVPFHICDKTYYRKLSDWKCFCVEKNLIYIS